MNLLRKSPLLAATVVALLLVAGPVTAAEDEAPGGDTEAPAEDTGAPADDQGRKVEIAQTPRDQVGLILLGALLVGGALALVNARRQLKGERPQASGEFRWR